MFSCIPSRLPVRIVVRGVAGGKWEFPLTLVASEPPVDDVIDIDAMRLGDTAAVGFRLTSTTRWAQASVFLARCLVLKCLQAAWTFGVCVLNLNCCFQES